MSNSEPFDEEDPKKNSPEHELGNLSHRAVEQELAHADEADEIDHHYHNFKKVAGHPVALVVLFFTEMWERFSYYGMRALLILYLTDTVTGLGWSAFDAGSLYGTYTMWVYLTTFVGGWLADRYLGFRRSVFVGGVLMMAGHLSLAFEGMSFFYAGLVLLVIGNGFFKPNISSMVGMLYPSKSALKDSAYTIFYMGINLGALFGSLACGYLGESEKYGWHWGFGAAGVGMGIGLLVFMVFQSHLGPIGKKPIEPGTPKSFMDTVASTFTMIGPGLMYYVYSNFGLSRTIWVGSFVLTAMAVATRSPKFAEKVGVGVFLLLAYISIEFSNWAILPVIGAMAYGIYNLSKDQPKEMMQRVLAIFIFAFFSIIFWFAFEQAGSSLNIFARDYADRQIAPDSFFYGWLLSSNEVPASWFQALNSLFIIMFAPVLSFVWMRLARVKLNPNSPVKFAFGLVFLGAGFLALAYGSTGIGSGAEVVKVSMLWLVLAYFLHTIGELCLSPIGLSVVNKLSPPKLLAMMFGVWFLASAIGNKIAGNMAGQIESIAAESSMSDFFMIFVVVTGIAALLMFALSPLLKKFMHGVK